MTDIPPSQSNPAERFQRLARLAVGPFAGVRINFGQDPQQKKLTITFSFISGLVALVVILTFVWALAAGVLQTGRFLQSFDKLFPGFPASYDASSIVAQGVKWIVLVLVLPIVYGLKAFGVAMLLFLAAASLGAAVGFLFGVPRPISESGPPLTRKTAGDTVPSQPGPEASQTTNATRRASESAPSWQANTNLTQISDWLTKIIVGVSLVEAHNIVELMTSLQRWTSDRLFDGYVGVNLVLPAIIIAGAVLGFLYFYLFTQLFLAAMMAVSANEISGNLLEEVPDAAAKIKEMSSTDPAVALLIQVSSGRVPAQSDDRPDPSQVAAAIKILSLPLDSLSDADSVVLWARSQALLDQWAAAMSGYDKLLRMRRRPEELAETARVCASAGDRVRARTLIDEAVLRRDEAPVETRGAMTFDAVYFALYDDPPAGYRRALNLLDPNILASDHRGGLFVLRACANGQRLKFEGTDLTSDAQQRLEREIVDDVKRALLNPQNLPWIRSLLGRDAEDQPLLTPNQGRIDDDLDVVRNNEELSKLVAPHATSAPAR